MKRIFSFLILFTSAILPQTPVGTYSLGAGMHYPRFISISTGSISENNNYGAYLSLQRKFSEHLGFRLSTNYSHLESRYGSPGILHQLNMISGNLDVLYEVFPCEILSPYFSAGFGATNFSSDNSVTAELNKNHWGYQMNIGFGVEYKFTDALSFKSEAVYRTSSDNKIDGNMKVNDKKGLFRSNGDAYLTVDLGLLWNFSIGDDFAYCEDCPDGIREIIRYDTLITEVPVEVLKADTVYVERPILFGINFDFDKYNLNPAAIPILEHTILVLKNYKYIKLKIAGHTDSKGTDEYNMNLSRKRARAVYDYLVLGGIPPERLELAGYGEAISIRENNTDEGRAFNRRVEFKIEAEEYTAR